MSSVESGLRAINGVNVLPLDGLWEAVSTTPNEEKIKTALGYAGCTFYDEDNRFVESNSISIVGIGGQPLAHTAESDEVIANRINQLTGGTREMMASSASLSYLNNGEKSQPDLYDTVTGLGHFSIAHTVSANIMIAGISEGAELELNLQRDLLHISKVTNARTNIQTRPPIVVPDKRLLALARSIEESTASFTNAAREYNDPDELEILNGFFPINKATLLMLSGDLSNFRKVVQLRDDRGKEKELRDVADKINTQLSTLWPEIFNDKEKQ
jgi:thymidylate synthase ThyX